MLIFGILLLRRRRRGGRRCDAPFVYVRLDGAERQQMLKLFGKLEALLSKNGFRRRWASEEVLSIGV